jgi:hypothetical protein
MGDLPQPLPTPGDLITVIPTGGDNDTDAAPEQEPLVFGPPTFEEFLQRVSESAFGSAITQCLYPIYNV